MKTYYEILGLPKTATKKEIKKAYLKLAKKYHPDLNQGSKESEEIFKQVNIAYEVLSDDVKKIDYDKKLEAEAKAQPGGKKQTSTGQGSRPQPKARRPAGFGASAEGINFENMASSFESFFGFDPKSKNITDEEKLNTYTQKERKRNPLDTTDFFNKWMGIK